MPIKTTIDVHSLSNPYAQTWNKRKESARESPIENRRVVKKKNVQFPFARVDDFDLRFRNICSIKV